MSNRTPTVVIKRFERRPSAAEVRRAVRAIVRRLGGMQRFVKPTSRVLIKPNLGSPASPTTGCVTDMRVLEEVIALVKKARPREVFLAEGALGPASSAEQFRVTGAARVASRQGVELIDLKIGRFVRVPVPGGRAVRSIEIGEAALRADVVIDVAALKAFIDDEGAEKEHLLFSLGMKNLKGLISNRSRSAFHRAEVVQAIVDLTRVITPRLTIIGGLYAAIGGDWRGSVPGAPLNVLLASDNVVAADAAAAALLGLDPWKVHQIRYAAERGLGPASFDEVEIVAPQPLDQIAADLAEKIARARRRRTAVTEGPIVIQRSACSGCKLAIAVAMNRLGSRAARLADWQVLMGQKVTPPTRKGRYLLVGNCSSRFKVRGVRIRGCPPTADAVYDALRAQVARAR